ncbi:MAG: TonB family protein [Cyanobacteria bacterium SIG31]|nr:TonB family protein [Cyanobacteria bacterium SIG31]
MSLISNKSFILDDEDDKDIESYTLPSLVTNKAEVIPIEKSVTGSVLLHILTPTLIWIISVVLLLMGINLSLFNKVKPQPKRDIEFVLVDKPGKPRDPNTKNRSDMDSRSGGVNDPKRKVSMPSPKPQKQQKPSAAANSANQIIKKQQQQVKQQAVQKPKPVAQPQPKPMPQTKQVAPVEKPSPTKPAPPSARPSARPVSAPAPVTKPTTPFSVPIPSNAPVGKTLSTGPVGGTSAPSGVAKSGSVGGPVTSSGAYAPRPSLSPSTGSSGNGQLARGTAPSGTGNVGNPGGGGGAPGIDALREPDFGPYMRELQRRIKLNWDPPKGNESKTVVLLFKIARDGRLLSCRVHRSSGLPSADQAALKAVELTAPFRPLPADFKGQNIDIQFTFDYRVFGASKY